MQEAFTIIKTENEEMVNEDVTVPTGETDSIDDLFCRQCLVYMHTSFRISFLLDLVNVS